MSVAVQQIDIRELRIGLGQILRRAQAGEAFVVVSGGKPIVELKGIGPAESKFRKPGALKGKVWMSDDFDDPPSDELAGCPSQLDGGDGAKSSL